MDGLKKWQERWLARWVRKNAKRAKKVVERATGRTVTQRVIRNARKKGVPVYNRKQWGTKHPRVYIQRRKTHPHFLLPDKPVDTLVHHITVTFDSGVLIDDFFTDMQTIERIGIERFGSGTSYNFLIDMTTGQVGLGQDLDVKGTHTVNDKKIEGFSRDQNGVALAIAFIGMPGKKLSRRAIQSWIRLTAALIEEKAVTETYDGCPHSMFAAKDCPTDAVRDNIQKVKLRALTMAKGA